MRPIRKCALACLAVLVMGVPLAGQASADEKYYAIFFASQSEPRQARFSHTFCTFIKADSGDATRQPAFIAQTISWLPTNGQVRVLKLRADAGRNFTLDETLRLVQGQGQHVRSWGPYEIPAETYNTLVQQKAKLDSGAYSYKAIDIRRPGAMNCIHAVTNANPKWGGWSVPDRAFGFPSGQMLAEAVTNGKQVLAKNQDWVLDRLAIRTGRGINFMDYDPERHVHIARTPAASEPVVVRQPDGALIR